MKIKNTGKIVNGNSQNLIANNWLLFYRFFYIAVFYSSI